MLPYGSKKRSFKIHPHNECDICGDDIIHKGGERRKMKMALMEIDMMDVKEEVESQIKDMKIKIPDDFGHRLLQAALVIQRDGSYQDYLNAITGRSKIPDKEVHITIEVKGFEKL